MGGGEERCISEYSEEGEAKREEEASHNWDEEKLKAVVLSKKGNQKTTTRKVGKFFREDNFIHWRRYEHSKLDQRNSLEDSR